MPSTVTSPDARVNDRASARRCRSSKVVDALSDVLRAVRLTGAVFFDIHASEPWVAETPAGASIVAAIFPGADHLIPYHVVTDGSVWGWVVDQPPVHLSTGDIIVFPQGDAHVMSSAPGCGARRTCRCIDGRATGSSRLRSRWARAVDAPPI
ncbi:MAG TPA: cupin domain-containing protein [Vicinamibacterales bacterium]|nr:cupin domain-containing protein [Vicinamibacterales bacterium]